MNFNFFRSKTAGPLPGRVPESAPRADPPIEVDVLPYPPVDPGIPHRSVDDMLATQHELIARIKLCYGADRPTFDAELLVLIRNYAAFVNVLPATSDNYFAGVGDLFRLGLEVGFFALQGTDAHIVSGRASISTRRQFEPRWRLATFIAGLCCELHRTLSHVVITDERGEAWPPYLLPLTTWLQQRGASHYFVRWPASAQESRALGLFALPHIVPARTMQHLAIGNTPAVPQMLTCLAGIPSCREQNVLLELVTRAAALVIDRDLIASATRSGKPILGAHLARYLLDAMRRLVVAHPAWAPNQERSRVWWASDGLFLVWPNAVNEIRKVLEEDELPGIAQSPETILEILLSAGVLVSPQSDQRVWTIAPPPGKTVMEAVKLASPEILLLGMPVASALSTSIVTRATVMSVAAHSDASASRHPDLVDAMKNTTTATGVPPPLAASTPPPPPAPPPSPAPPRPPPAAKPPDTLRLQLAAPMRLSPHVRDALVEAVNSLNGDAKAASAIALAEGIFIPFKHFKRRRLDITVVLRALGDAGMTVDAKGSSIGTHHHDISGHAEPGLILKPTFVTGLDPANFVLTP